MEQKFHHRISTEKGTNPEPPAQMGSGSQEGIGTSPGTRPREDIGAMYASLLKRFDDLVGRSPAGVFRTTIDGRFLECNGSMAMMLGYDDREELMRTNARELYHSAKDRERFIERLRSEGKLINFELGLRHKSGRRVEVMENVFIDDHEGEITIQGMMIDITQMRQAERHQQAVMEGYKNLVEHIRDGLLVVDRQNNVRYANPAARILFDIEQRGGSVTVLFHPDDQQLVQQFFEKAGGVEMTTAAHARTRGGTEVMLQATTLVYEGVPAIQVTIQDEDVHRRLYKERNRVQMAEEVNAVLREEIAEHRRTQEALSRSRRFARGLVDSSLDMIIASDPEGRITEYNPAATLRFGWESEEIMGLPTNILFSDPADYDRVQRELDMHGIFTGEVVNLTKYGERFTAFISASRLYDEHGVLLGSMGVSRDITRMKRDQEALRVSEERYRDLFENASDLIQSVDPQGVFQYVNSAWLNTLGYDRSDLEGLTIIDVLHPDHREQCMELFGRIFSSPGSNLEIKTIFRTKEGRDVLVEGTSNARFENGVPVATRTILRDVTSVQEARRQVQEHEAKLRALFESSEHMFWTVDKEIRLTSFNRGYSDMIERLHGTRPEINKDPARPRRRFASETYHEFWETRYAEAFKGSPIRFETDLVDKQGRRVCNEIFLSPVFDEAGRVREVFGVGHEITTRKVAEELVRERTARLKAIFDSAANMMIWTLDHQLRITSCNEHFVRAIEQEHGFRLSVGDDFVKRMAPRLAPGSLRTILRHYHAALNGRARQFEVELVDHNGRPAWVENFLNPIIVDGKVHELSCLAYGITDRKDAQMELLSSLQEKEVLLKEVHHRVKNNLQIISSIFNLQSAHVGDDRRVLDLLRDSRDRIRSMSFIHESLYQSRDLSSVDLAGYMEGLGRNLMLSYSLTGKVALECELEPVELVLDQAIPCGLILNELITNALKHAFPEAQGGVIRLGLAMEGNSVRMTVSDNGRGLPPGFEPGRDGNLGLELVRTLVDQLDGSIAVSSGPGLSYLITFERTKNP